MSTPVLTLNCFPAFPLSTEGISKMNAMLKQPDSTSQTVSLRRTLTAALCSCGKLEAELQHDGDIQQAIAETLKHIEGAAIAARQLCQQLYPVPPPEIKDAMPVPGEISATEYGMTVTIPALLPLRCKDGKYIRTTLQGLCCDKGRSFLRDVVVAVEEKYSDGTPLRQWRDHDNVELAGVLNEMSLWVLAGDNPADVDLFQFAAKGEQNVTVIHVIARAKFPDWVVKKWGKTVKIKETDFTPRPPPICIADTGVFERLHEPTVVERYTWIG